MSTWRKFDDPTPYPVVAGFAINRDNQFIFLHRSDKVRSAPNCWSLPSGLHEVGESMISCFERELYEELRVRRMERTPVTILPAYENIPGDGWHWVISTVVVFVEGFEFTNLEPDKHDDVRWLDVDLLRNPMTLFRQFPVHESAIGWYCTYARRAYDFAMTWSDRSSTRFQGGRW